MWENWINMNFLAMLNTLAVSTTEDQHEAQVLAQEDLSDRLEKDFSQDTASDFPPVLFPDTIPAPAEESAQEPQDTVPAPAHVEVVPEVNYEPLEYRVRGERSVLIFQGVCTNCAHCALKLTDAVSQNRGLGPLCSKRGYAEDPVNADEVQAMIDLAEFPKLVEFLTLKYKPQGVRALMNGLVRICSLNRRSPVHQACTDAIESLGYKALASKLRESISVVEIREIEGNDSEMAIWIKKTEWKWAWSNEFRANIPNSYFSKKEKGTVFSIAFKPAVWNMVKKHYHGFYCKTPKGCVKIPQV